MEADLYYSRWLNVLTCLLLSFEVEETFSSVGFLTIGLVQGWLAVNQLIIDLEEDEVSDSHDGESDEDDSENDDSDLEEEDDRSDSESEDDERTVELVTLTTASDQIPKPVESASEELAPPTIPSEFTTL